MKVLFIGSKDRGVLCLQALLDAGHDVAAVVTEPDDDPDAFWEGSVEEAAADRGLPACVPDDVNDPSFVAELSETDVELGVMSGFSQVLGTDLLELPAEGIVNLHAGKLPEYRGGSPMNWALINGEEEITFTVHYATERIDAGPVIAEATTTVAETDTIADVRDRSLEAFPELLVHAVDAIEDGTATVREQNPDEGTYWCSRMPQDGRIRWNDMTAREVYDFVRALSHPYPGAFTTLDGERLYVWSASLPDGDVRHAPGRVCMRRGDGRVVAARDRGIILETVQHEGEKERPAAELLDRGTYLR